MAGGRTDGPPETVGISAVADGSTARWGPAGGIEPAGEVGEALGRAGPAPTLGMNAVGASPPAGIGVSEAAGRIAGPGADGRGGSPAGVPGLVGVACGGPGVPPVAGGRLDDPGAGVRVGRSPRLLARAGAWLGAVGRPGVAGGRPDPACGPGVAAPGQGGGAPTDGGIAAGAAAGGGIAAGGGTAAGGSGLVGGRVARGRVGSSGVGQLLAGPGRADGSGRSTFGRNSVGSSAWSRCRPSAPLTWAP